MTARTATNETRRVLKRAIGSRLYSTWAREHGLPPITVFHALNNKPMSAMRENEVRFVLGLPLLPEEVRIVRLTEQQRVVTRGRPVKYVSRQVRLSPDEAARLDRYVRDCGYPSFSAYFRNEVGRQMGVTARFNDVGDMEPGADDPE